MTSGPEPRVQDCAMIHQATPTVYICKGRAYTADQLANIREGEPMW